MPKAQKSRPSKASPARGARAPKRALAREPDCDPKSEPSGDTPTEPELNGVRLRILRGAAKVFAERGYGTTSVEGILEAAEVSRRTFYKAFRSKEDVLRTLFDNSVQLLLRTVQDTGEQRMSRSERAQASVEAYIRVHANAGPLARVLLQEQFSPDSPLIEQRNRAMQSFTDLIAKSARQTGKSAPDTILVAAVVAAINHVCIQMATEHPDGNWDVPRAKRAILRILFALDDRSDPSTWT